MWFCCKIVSFLQNTHERCPMGCPCCKGIGCLLWVQRILGLFIQREVIWQFSQKNTLERHPVARNRLSDFCEFERYRGRWSVWCVCVCVCVWGGGGGGGGGEIKRYSSNVVNCLKITHTRHPIASLWVWAVGCFCEWKVWAMFYFLLAAGLCDLKKNRMSFRTNCCDACSIILQLTRAPFINID